MNECRYLHIGVISWFLDFYSEVVFSGFGIYTVFRDRLGLVVFIPSKISKQSAMLLRKLLNRVGFGVDLGVI